jgi:hypothetical protein
MTDKEKLAKAAREAVARINAGDGQAIWPTTLVKRMEIMGILSSRDAVIYKDTEWDEFRVLYFINCVYQEDADSFHDDMADAISSAKMFAK